MIDELISQWMKKTGPDSDVVISSRIRLARNLENIKFTNQASEDELKEVINNVNNLLLNDNKFGLNLLELSNLSQNKKNMLVERHLISPDLSERNINNAVALSSEETISLMINEEDHLRLQVLLPGLQLQEAWDLADKIDDYLEQGINIAFDEKYGYLTACPTNVGTGLRSSIMVHLPALTMVNRVKNFIAAISQLGLAVRGLYGEGTETVGNLYQISNQVTLGRSEDEIIENLIEVTHQIITQERNAREILLKEKEMFLKDQIYRAYGTLKYAYKISVEEAMKLISNVRLGIDLGIIEDVESTILNQLMVIIRPATLQVLKGEEMTIEDRHIYRAQLIRERLQ
ncbi:protein arginine kinase [Orenia metallireducens]|jgi:protein arginine kinase|uniref:Protein-arginine kinase n=1 Tax=Orenia metallireducens TaxID=1413210 RepID=A0A1C0ABY3_9FIRM|nr:protein arginine kinase [Orenia metallireducens]OCL27866.1 protein arginine kinase [Orenia metallireducens]